MDFSSFRLLLTLIHEFLLCSPLHLWAVITSFIPQFASSMHLVPHDPFMGSVCHGCRVGRAEIAQVVLVLLSDEARASLGGSFPCTCLVLG